MLEQLNQPIIIGTLVMSVYGLIEILKRRENKKNGHANGIFSQTDRNMIHDLHVSHSRTDTDGIPLWYVPRRLIADSEETNRKLGLILSELKQLNTNFSNWDCPYKGE